MFSFFTSSISNPPHQKYINFEDMQFVLQHPDRFYLINTLPIHLQYHLIPTTIPANQEETKINDILEQGQTQEKEKIIVIYGMNTTDTTPEKKYDQLRSLHFTDIYIYSGGMFEWLLLQDIYGSAEFPISSFGREYSSGKLPDILVYKGERLWPN